jgi:hypothetical protein
VNWVEGWGAVVVCAVDGRDGEIVTACPAFGGGGTIDCAAVVCTCGTAPGCGGGGDCVDDVVGRVDVGVGMRFACDPPTAAVGAGKLGAAPACAGKASGCTAEYMGEYEGAVAVADVV